MSHRIGIGIIGMGWMGQAHARAHTQVKAVFPEYNLNPELVICADQNENAARTAKEKLDFKEYTTDWRKLLERDDVDVICVTSPNFLHKEMSVAVAEAGKHLMCEKPVGRTPQETLEIGAAVRKAGVNSAVGFNYRWAPVVQYANDMIKKKELGDIQVYYGRFFSLYGSDPLGVWTWRFDEQYAGSGAINDLLTHVIDTAWWLNSSITSVMATKHTFITERPLPDTSGGHYSVGSASAPKKPVTNEDYVSLMVKFSNGSRGVFEAARTVYGPKCELRFDVYGDRGSVRWNMERMNEIELCLKDRGPDGYTQVFSGVEHPFHSQFNPGDAIALGYPDLKIIEAAHFFDCIARNQPFDPGLNAAVNMANVVIALDKSAQSGHWEEVTQPK